ncbi:hypothetical protein BGZ63DRAFT_208028 [Mariannaea sp. PMI_226]|nr:hypothetical protein BGZ63DRAFT_208028 [Mariannaea sp. PMI_226]
MHELVAHENKNLVQTVKMVKMVKMAFVVFLLVQSFLFLFGGATTGSFLPPAPCTRCEKRLNFLRFAHGFALGSPTPRPFDDLRQGKGEDKRHPMAFASKVEIIDRENRGFRMNGVTNMRSKRDMFGYHIGSSVGKPFRDVIVRGDFVWWCEEKGPSICLQSDKT